MKNYYLTGIVLLFLIVSCSKDEIVVQKVDEMDVVETELQEYDLELEGGACGINTKRCPAHGCMPYTTIAVCVPTQANEKTTMIYKSTGCECPVWKDKPTYKNHYCKYLIGNPVATTDKSGHTITTSYFQCLNYLANNQRCPITKTQTSSGWLPHKTLATDRHYCIECKTRF